MNLPVVISEQQYEELVHLIYSSNERPQGWKDFCEKLATLYNATLVHILAVDKKYGAYSFSAIGGPNDSIERSMGELAYIQTPTIEDPRFDVILNEQIQGWIQCHKFFSPEFVKTSRLFQEFLIPFDVRYSAIHKLLEDKDVTVIFSMVTSEQRQPLLQDDLKFLDRLIPHLQRMVAMQKQIYHFSAQALVGYSLINNLHQPVILINLAGGITFCNNAGKQLLKSTSLISIENNRLTLPEPYFSQFREHCFELEKQYLADNLLSMVDKNKTCFKVESCTEENHPESLYIFSSLMFPEQTKHVFGVRPIIMLTLYHPDFSPQVDMQLLSTAFDLSPRECQIALQLMEGLSVKEISSKDGVAADTVRKQLKSIYHKTRTNRQSELIKLLMNFPRTVNTNLSLMQKPVM